MEVTVVYVQVKPEHLQDFIAATKANAEASIAEPGNRRFDVLQRHSDPCRFILYEAYVSPEAAAAHKNTPHYLAWREKVADWMAAPREGVLYHALFP